MRAVDDKDECRREFPDREYGPAVILGPRQTAGERGVVSPRNSGRCYALWTVLRGAGCDFDDLIFAVAEHLGYEHPTGGGCDLFESLAECHDIVNLASWRVVRSIAVDVFFEKRGGPDSRCYEPHEMDYRTFDEIADDFQFDGNGCRLCMLDGLPEDLDSPEGHRHIARMLASGRVKPSDMGLPPPRKVG